MRRRAVNQFIVAPPAEQVSEIMQAEEQFKAHLAQSFPGYDFIVTSGLPFEASDFQVFPMMGYVGDGPRPDGAFEMCEMPEGWLMEDIRETCRKFDIAASKRRLS